MTEEIQQRITDFLTKIENDVIIRYRLLVSRVLTEIDCAISQKPIGLSEELHPLLDEGALWVAGTEIKKDVDILLKRRDKLIDPLRPNVGKIAGIIAYRLGKMQIMHLRNQCVVCREYCIGRLNTTLALQCALEYAGIDFEKVPDDIRLELHYVFLYRHMNQEALGLVFDALFSTMPRKELLPTAEC